MNVLELELKEALTKDGVWVVTYDYKKAPADVQEAAFVAHGLSYISPAELAFLRVNVEGDTFAPYSRTCGEAFVDDRDDGKVVVLPRGGISRIVGIANIVAAHKTGREFVIPESYFPGGQREQVYGLVDECLRNGSAVCVRDETNTVATDKFGEEELTEKLYSDERLGVKAEDYGRWLRERGIKVHNLFIDDVNYARQQGGPYINRVRLWDASNSFFADGGYGYLHIHNGAFGVFIKKSVEGSAKK